MEGQRDRDRQRQLGCTSGAAGEALVHQRSALLAGSMPLFSKDSRALSAALKLRDKSSMVRMSLLTTSSGRDPPAVAWVRSSPLDLMLHCISSTSEARASKPFWETSLLREMLLDDPNDFTSLALTDGKKYMQMPACSAHLTSPRATAAASCWAPPALTMASSLMTPDVRDGSSPVTMCRH